MGLIFKQDKPAGGVTEALHEVPEGNNIIFDLNACNTGATSAVIRVSIDTTAGGGSETFFEYDTSLAAGGDVGHVLERTGRKAPAGAVINVYSSTGDVDFTLDGIEEAV